MTNSEVIERLKSILETGISDDEVLLFTEDYEAIDYAINALKQKPIFDKIRDEIVHLHDWAFSREEILRIIDKHKAESEGIIDAIDFAIKVTDSQDDYSMGMRNGMRYVKSLIDDKEPQYESRWSDEEIELGIILGDEVVSDYGAKGVVVGIDTYKGEVWLSLLMKNHKVPQLVKASWYKTKTGKHFPQIIEVLEQIKGESDGK